MNEHAGGQPTLVQLGRRVRRERRRRGWALKELSERSGVSFGSVSELERGLGNPSLLSLQRIADALGVTTAALLEIDSEEPMVVRADARPLLPGEPGRAADEQAVRELLSPRSQAALHLIRTTLPPGFSNEGHGFRHLGVEAVVVLQGTLEVVHGTTRTTLAIGDAMTYPCSTLHWWRNLDPDPTVVLGAVTPFES